MSTQNSLDFLDNLAIHLAVGEVRELNRFLRALR